MSQKDPKKRTKLRFEQLDPVALLDVGYCVHAASDENLKKFDNAEYAAAKKVAEYFLSLKADPNTPAGEYLLRVTAIVTSHARAVTRRKQEFIKEMLSAQDEYDFAYNRLREGKVKTIAVKIIWRGVAAFVVAIIGFILAWIAAPLVPETVGESTGKGLPSLAIALISGAFIWYGSWWIDDTQRGRMIGVLRIREKTAKHDYEDRKIEEQRIHWELLAQAWYLYTGKRFRKRPPLEKVMRGDQAMNHYLHEVRTEYSRSPMMYVVHVCRTFVLRHWGRVRKPETA